MDNLRRLQLYELDILLKFKEICEKNNLKYFLIGGTLLGAVRHKGFIPWDDDIDVGMPRNDYDKFLEIGQKELGEKYFLHNWNTDPNYCWPHSMIRLNDTSVFHNNSKYDNKLISKGIGIDIFVFDNMVKNKKQVKKQYQTSMIYKWLLFGKANCFVFHEMSLKKKIIYAGSILISIFINRSTIIQSFESNAEKFNNEKCSAIIDVGGLQGLNDWIEYENSHGMPLLEFEGYYFYVPQKYEDVLTRAYGNYMELPPIEKRKLRHEIQKYEFGNYEPACYLKVLKDE